MPYSKSHQTVIAVRLVFTEVEGADKGEWVEDPSPGVRGACNEAPAVVSIIVVEVQR